MTIERVFQVLLRRGTAIRAGSTIYRRTIVASTLLLSACIAANAGQIWFNDTTLGTGWVLMGAGGTFNTGGNTNCGIGANCNEGSLFGAANIAGGGVNIGGAMTFTTNDIGGVTTLALERGTMAIDNTGAAAGNQNVIVAFVSDEFDPSGAGSAGVGISGFFLNDGLGGIGWAADTQAEMDYYQNGGVWGGAPGLGSFSLLTPLVGGAGIAPTAYFTLNAIPGPILGIQELVGYVGVDVLPNSEVTFPFDVEDNDSAALLEDAPEPSSYLLLGFGLAGVGLLWRKSARV